MTLRPVLPVLITIALSGAALGAQAQFTLMATVIDPASGQPPDTLVPADVRVAEDGVAATVTKVESVVRTVKVQVLIDNGGAVGRAISELRGGVRRLLEGLPADVEVTLVTTAPQPRFLVRATKNREELLKGVDRIVPDSGTGRFTESLSEAAERANKEKDTFNVIITAGSTAGDGQILETDMNRALDRIRGKPMLVHVLLYYGERTSSGGVAQVEVGERAAQMTGGRYEFVNTMSRYTTLLPELGADVAKQVAGNTRQFRFSVRRPEGKKGDLGKVTVGIVSKIVTSVRHE
ncbi:MAG TPA: VWA domain-containing protein [Vicinamibacterales bacterium]|nr:VWA domain-containing protein [Vicinamibacterales bacterium]